MTDTERVKLAQKILLTALEADPDEGGRIAYMEAVYDVLTWEDIDGDV